MFFVYARLCISQLPGSGLIIFIIFFTFHSWRMTIVESIIIIHCCNTCILHLYIRIGTKYPISCVTRSIPQMRMRVLRSFNFGSVRVPRRKNSYDARRSVQDVFIIISKRCARAHITAMNSNRYDLLTFVLSSARKHLKPVDDEKHGNKSQLVENRIWCQRGIILQKYCCFQL